MAEEHLRLAGAAHGVMRELNRTLVLDVLREHGPISRSGIAKKTTLTKPTVSAIVDELISEDLVREIGPGRAAAEGGRPPILLEFNALSSYVVGVHLGVRRSTVVVADARGAELERTQLETPRGDPEETLGRLADTVKATMAAAQADPQWWAALGVCVPGLVDLHRGVCLLAPNLGWQDVPVQDILRERLGVDVFVHNTAQACAVAETVDGAAKGASEVVLLYAGTGVGAGVISAGRLFHGWAGIAGEVGHCPIDGVSRECRCGNVGCLEAVASAPAIVRASTERGVQPPPGEELRIEHVVAAARAGDRAARESLEEAGRALGVAAAWLVNVLNPEVLVVGGGLAGAGEDLLGPLRHSAIEHALPQAAERVSIRPWALGQEAKARGAVLVAMQNAETYYRLIFRD